MKRTDEQQLRHILDACGWEPERKIEVLEILSERAKREILVRDHGKLVKFYAAKLTPPVGIEFEDLVSTGFLAIFEAASRFDPERGIKFSTFASRRIHGAMIDFLRDYAFGKRDNLKREHRVLCTPQEDLSGFAHPGPPMEDAVDAKVDAEDLMRRVTGKDHQLLELRFCQGMTLKKIGALFGVTESRACQLVGAALSRARRKEPKERKSRVR